MAAVSVKKTVYGSWGNCIELSNGIVELIATVDFGPRIIRYGFVGGTNMMKENTDPAVGTNKVNRFSENEQEWKIYGGHRFWTSPEALPRTYYPDNEPVAWEALDNGVLLTPPSEAWTQLQKQMEVKMDPLSGEVTIIHRVTNVGAWPAEFAPWALSVMAEGGTAIIPQVKRETGLLGNRVLALWPYSKMNDSRVHWGEHFILLRQGPGETPFKLGTNNENGWAAYYNNNHLFIKYYKHDPEAVYPDFGVSLEAYVCDHFLELETLGKLQAVRPDETVSHQEVWNLFSNVQLPAGDETRLLKELHHYLKE